MDKNILNRQSQHWETNFSNKPEMFGLEPSLPAKKALNIFKENNYSKIVELGAGLGRDSIYFGKNSINVTALDYSENGIKIINEKIKKENLTSSISTLKFDIREDLPFETNSVDACYSHMLYCMALTQKDLDKLNSEIHRILKPGGKYYFCEHGISPDLSTRVFQNVTNIFYPKLSGGCHANRDIPKLISESGLKILEKDTMYLPGSVKFLGYNYWGVAIR